MSNQRGLVSHNSAWVTFATSFNRLNETRDYLELVVGGNFKLINSKFYSDPNQQFLNNNNCVQNINKVAFLA